MSRRAAFDLIMLVFWHLVLILAAWLLSISVFIGAYAIAQACGEHYMDWRSVYFEPVDNAPVGGW